MNLKLAGGTLGAGFVVGAIFWAGATYQRLSGMESHIASIDAQMQQLIIIQRDIATVRAITDESQRRIGKLEDLLRNAR